MLRLTLLLALAAPAGATEFDPDGPFRPGEGFGVPATCDTLPDWIQKAPEDTGRISMTITGTIRQSHWDGALAYLIMCDPEEVQVMCVTYEQQPASDTPVLFAGGFVRVDDRRVMLDPCLTYPVE